MAGNGDSGNQGGLSSAAAPGTWRITGEGGIQGRHGEVLGMRDDTPRAGTEEPWGLEDLQREATRVLFTGASGSRPGTGARARTTIGSMRDLFGLRDRIRAKRAVSHTGRRLGGTGSADEANTPPRPGPPPETEENGPRLVWRAPRSLTSARARKFLARGESLRGRLSWGADFDSTARAAVGC